MPTQAGTIPILGRVLRGRRILVATALLAAEVSSPSVLQLGGPVAAAPLPQLIGASGHTVGPKSSQGGTSPAPGPAGATLGPLLAPVSTPRARCSIGSTISVSCPLVTHTAGSGVDHITFPTPRSSATQATATASCRSRPTRVRPTARQ